MLVLDMPTTFTQGSTQPCKLNGEPMKVKWDGTHLVFTPPDADAPADRRLILIQLGDEKDKMLTFYCAPAADTEADADADGFTLIVPTAKETP